jgi:hypothetical protein
MVPSLDLAVGAVVGVGPAVLLSRLALWTLRVWHADLARLIVGHATSWILCSLIAAPLFSAPGEPYGLRAAVILAFPQLCVLLFDAVRRHGANHIVAAPNAVPKRRLIARKLPAS